MGSLSDKELAALLEVARQQIVVGALYRHYKGKLYKVLNVALEESSLKVVVVYQAQYGANIIFTRSVSEWNEEVEQAGQSILRFQLVEKNAQKL